MRFNHYETMFRDMYTYSKYIKDVLYMGIKHQIPDTGYLGGGKENE